MSKLFAAIAIAASFAFVENAQAQTYPLRPITIVVPFPAGGPTDALARILAERMRGPLGQPVIIENPTGAEAPSAPTASRGLLNDGLDVPQEFVDLTLRGASPQ